MSILEYLRKKNHYYEQEEQFFNVSLPEILLCIREQWDDLYPMYIDDYVEACESPLDSEA